MGGHVLILEEHIALRLRFPWQNDSTNLITRLRCTGSPNLYILNATIILPIDFASDVESQIQSAIANDCDIGVASNIEKEVSMDFIEQWLHISPDGGSGASELLIVTAVLTIAIGIGILARHGHFPRNLIEFIEQFGRRESSDRFDN